MKKILLPIIAITVLFTTSCQDMFNTDSSSVIFEENNQLSSTSDSLYSVMGILSQIGKLGERYVLAGELRGDLMQTTSDAPQMMQELAQFNLSDDNTYKDLSDYYAVINSCNYALSRMDTTLLSYQTKVMLPEWVAIKTLRAWTYWQVALMAGSVHWMTLPVKSVQEAFKTYPEKNQEDLAQLLINELKPYTETRELNYGTIDSHNSTHLFIPVNMLLGDLYLFLNQYEEAALAYYDVIERHNLTVTSGYTSQWQRSVRDNASMNHNDAYQGELLSGLAYSSNPADYHPMLVRYTYNDVPSLIPSTNYLHQMEDIVHLYGEYNSTQVLGYFQGDLRGCAHTSKGETLRGDYTKETLNGKEGTYIYKFMRGTGSTSAGYDPQNLAIKNQLIFTRMIPIYRSVHAYLRLAESLNRMGKPTMAFATLKYGLNNNSLNDSTRVNQEELSYPFTEFARSNYNANVGTASRGRGTAIPYDDALYIIPELPTLQDSIMYVEDQIVDELAAETAFEGNRFFDLLRISRHRDQYPAYMADKVSARFANREAMRQQLMQTDAWYVK